MIPGMTGEGERECNCDSSATVIVQSYMLHDSLLSSCLAHVTTYSLGVGNFPRKAVKKKPSEEQV